VVGLGSLTVTNPDGLIPALDLGDFSYDSDTDTYDLCKMGMVSGAVDKLSITATSAVADASLTITPPPAGNPQAVSLNPGPNTVTIKVRLDKRGHSTNIEERTYTLTVYRTPELYVSPAPAGNDTTGDGSLGNPYATIQKALTRTKDSGFDTYAIIISGTINGGVNISGSGYPHIILKGADTGTNIISASGTSVLSIGGGNTVSLGDNLILTGGSAVSGGGVYVAGTFIMTGGYIQGNSTSSYGNGGGVYVEGGKFTMSGGYIQNNTAGLGGGVLGYLNGIFTMTGGTIQGNTATIYGGGVCVSGSGSTFTKTGGTIDGNNNAPTGRAVATLGGNACNLTVGPAVNLYAAYNSGVWSYADLPSPPGIGDTTGNWQ
jgi:hypothetical protein